MNWKIRKIQFNAFSTIDAMISAVLITISLLLLHSVLGTSIEKDRTLCVTKGIMMVEDWRNVESPENETTLEFEGGKVVIQITNENDHLNSVFYEIRDIKNNSVYNWEEFHLIP